MRTNRGRRCHRKPQLSGGGPRRRTDQGQRPWVSPIYAHDVREPMNGQRPKSAGHLDGRPNPRHRRPPSVASPAKSGTGSADRWSTVTGAPPATGWWSVGAWMRGEADPERLPLRSLTRPPAANPLGSRWRREGDTVVAVAPDGTGCCGPKGLLRARE
jgi:hypothetical protein